MFLKSFKWMFVALVCAGCSLINAQESPRALMRPSGRLQILSRSAGAIFTGTVIAVDRVPPRTEDELDSMQVTFRVTHALRGAHAGRDLTRPVDRTLGRWRAYRVGEQVLLFLYPPSQLGLTSPVAGREGRFPMDGQGRVVVRDDMLREIIGVHVGAAAEATPAAGDFSGTSRINYRELFRAIQRGS